MSDLRAEYERYIAATGKNVAYEVWLGRREQGLNFPNDAGAAVKVSDKPATPQK